MTFTGRPLLRILLGAATLFAAGTGWITYLSLKDYSTEFRQRKGTLQEVGTKEYARDSLTSRQWVTLKSDNGFTVVCGLLAPESRAVKRLAKLPAIIVLGGKATGKHAVDYALGIRNVIIIAPDYPYEPRESYTLVSFTQDLPAIRQALFDMVPAIMLVNDYLMSRGDVDPRRIILLGYSFGAPFVPVAIANDRRPAVAAMVYGGGDLHTLIRHNVRRYQSSMVSELVGLTAAVLLRPLEPMRYVDQIAPVPLLMVNGTNDEQVPRENTELLFNAALEPKQIAWIESRHVNPRNIELTLRIIDTLHARLTALGVIPLPEAFH